MCLHILKKCKIDIYKTGYNEMSLVVDFEYDYNYC